MTAPLTDISIDRAFPELAAAVRSVVASTAVEWERRVREALPSADHLTIEQVRDDMPQVLAHMANSLEANKGYEAESLKEAAPKHGAVRYHQGFRLGEVLIEYRILRMTLVRHVANHLGRDLSTAEVLALGTALDIPFRLSVLRFVDHLTHQLQVATEAQSKYLSFLSHDLRGGLNGVFLMIEVLKRELAAEERLAHTIEDLDIMRRSLLETVSTMDRFLHAERFRKGKVQVRPASVNLPNLILETVAHFAYQANDKSVAVDTFLSDDLTIVSDKELLALILQNLLSNALKYTGRGTNVTITGKHENNACVLSIKDQGPGIAPEKIGGLFDPFSRGETYGQPGVGLGLSIVRQAAEYLKARIWVESQVGGGSTFFVELPDEIKK